VNGRDRAAGPRTGSRRPGDGHPEGGGSGCARRTARPIARAVGFASVAEALRAGDMVAEYLNSPAAAGLEGAASGEALITIGRITSRLAAAQATLLARFDAGRRP